jgi:Predicted ATPase
MNAYAIGSTLVGRTVELSALSSTLSESAVGQARTCVIQGEAGTGKSILWQYALQDARERGFQVLSSAPGAPEPLAFAGLIELFDDLDDVFACLPVPQRDLLNAALLRTVPNGSSPTPSAVGVAVLTLIRSLAAAAPVLVAVGARCRCHRIGRAWSTSGCPSRPGRLVNQAAPGAGPGG